MNIDEIEFGEEPLVLATGADVDELESALWITLPSGYREFVTRIGEGTLGTYLRIYAPWRIAHELVEWRRRINKYWCWEESHDVLPRDRAVECVIVGDTIDGDELVFHPRRPNRLFVLPRHSAGIFEVGSDLYSALEWVCTSGELADPFEERDFEPFDSRDEISKGESTASKSIDPEGEALDDILELGKHWAQRHKVRKLAQKDLEKEMKISVKTESKANLLYEAFVVEGHIPHSEGYEIAWAIRDVASRLDVAVIRWHKGEYTHGCSYEPNKANLAKIRESGSK